MPRLPSLTGQDAINAFKKLGFDVDRIEGSHHILKKTGFKYNLSVPVHGQENIKPGTLRTLIRLAGITKEEFCKVLE
jgi:predicted RNA binding protein YcfA (HicA-like mRNA interferase family)